MSMEFDNFETRMKQRFDESVESIDAASLSRIRQARSSALEVRQTGPGNIAYWLPAGAAASTVLAILIMSSAPQKQAEEQPFIDEVDIISNLELYENLEFYEWLEQHELPT